MKEIQLDEFKARMDEIISEIINYGGGYKVNTGKELDIVIMEEPEFKILKEAFTILMTLNLQGKINLNELK